jgi:hypothetical protein
LALAGKVYSATARVFIVHRVGRGFAAPGVVTENGLPSKATSGVKKVSAKAASSAMVWPARGAKSLGTR